MYYYCGTQSPYTVYVYSADAQGRKSWLPAGTSDTLPGTGSDGSSSGGSSGDDNVLEGVQVGGVDLPIDSNKKVNITKVPSAATADGADKLNTTRKIFGNNFNGTEDISGTLNDVTNINASGIITTKNLKVTGSATFFELLIDKVKSAGGSAMFSPADGFDIEAMETYGGYIYLYWRASDGEQTIDNMWQVNDQALCKTFNRRTGAKEWWSLVKGVGQSIYKKDGSTPIDNERNLYNYIALSTSDTSGTFNPTVGDSVVMCGNRNNTARQGLIYISAYDGVDTGISAPFVAQYRGVNSFNLASHRKSYFDKNGAKFVGNFKVTSGDEEKDLYNYIKDNIDLEGRIIINGDDEDAPSTSASFISGIISKVGDPKITNISHLVGAVYINTKKMFWMLTYKNGVYSWEEDTDGTLARLYEEYEAQKVRIDLIVDDYCFSEDERSELRRIVYTGESRTRRIYELYLEYITNQGVSDSYEEYESAWTGLKNMVFDIDKDMPCYLSDAPNKKQGVRILAFTKQEFENAYQLYLQKYEAFNDAIINFTVNNIGEGAAESAKKSAIKYVEEHINEILDEGTKSTVEGWIRDYGSGNFAAKSEMTSTKESLSALTTWVGMDTIGGTGLITHLNTLFVGTQSITISDGKVVNIDKSGLVTDTGFAALFAKEEDSRGVTSALAELGTYVEHVGLSSLPSGSNKIDDNTWYNAQLGKYIYKSVVSADTSKGPYYYVNSNIAISADNIEMKGGSEKLGNYFSLSNGNLWCQNLTVEGVFNNLVNTIDVRNGINADKVIYNTDYNSLDVLNLGDVISLVSTHNGTNDKYLELPYYIDSSWNRRTKTRYGGTLHDITPKELKQLIGRKITIMVDGSDYMARYLYGAFHLEYAGTIEDSVQLLGNGISMMRTPKNEMGIALGRGTVIHLEFKPIQFVQSGRSTFGYAWVVVSNPGCGLDDDDNWKD